MQIKIWSLLFHRDSKLPSYLEVDDGYAVEFVNTKAGEVIFFKPLLLHGSNKIKRACVRRVFQALCIERS